MHKNKTMIHFILKNKLFTKISAYHVPSKGDEIRLSKNKFYKIIKLVWVYDEPDSLYERVNIGIKEIP